MFERLTNTVLQQALKEYFVLDDAHDANVMDVWSGFVRWNQMELRTAWLNEKIQAKGLPFEVLRGHVNLLTISIPWSKLNLLSTRKNNKSNNYKRKKDAGDAGNIVVVLDGVQLLVRSKYEFDDDALDQARTKSRRRKLQQAKETAKQTNNNSPAGGWHENLRQRLKDGILSQILDNLHLHIRDLHVRFEDIQSSPHLPMAFGLVAESIHLQHVENNNNDHQATEPTWVQKQSQVNHFAIYANALEETDISMTKINRDDNSSNNNHRWSERSILQYCAQRDVVVEVLDRSIPRRANSLQATTRLAPQHTYVLHPVDATAHLESGTDPSLRVAQNRPVLSVEVIVPTVHMALQDVHVHAALAWWANFQDHKYRARYRPFRPRVSVTKNPRAWWHYAATAIQFELQQSRLHWSWRRFHRRYSIRKRYCDLYEQRMRVELDAVDAVSLSQAEEAELQAMEDGTLGDLTVEDILLYRAIVQMRLGETTPRSKRTTRKQSSLLMTTSWLQKTLLGMVKDDSAATDEFQRAIDLWEEAKQNMGPPLEESASWVAISVGFTVDKGIVSAYTPLRSTIDQTAPKRLQMLFLSFVFQTSRIQGRLLGDFESLRLDAALQDFFAEEERSDRTRHTVVAREVTIKNNILPDAMHVLPILKLQFLKNSKRSTDDFHIGINAELQKLVVTLQPGCEWIESGRSLVRPLPRFTKLKEFWGDVGMNFINTMKTHGREIFAKAETAVADHKSVDVDIWINCPIVQIHGDIESHLLEIDFGQTRMRTERLAGVAKSKLLGTLKDEAKLRSAFDEFAERGENDAEFHRANFGGVNESIRSVQFNDLIDGIQVYRDDMTALDDLAHTPEGVMSVGIESFFYDTYVIDIKTGIVRLQNSQAASDILQQIEARATMQKSIIPRDSTLFRYKMLYSVGETHLSVSEEDVFLLRDMLSTWRAVIDASYKNSKGNLDLSVHYGNVGLFLQDSTRNDVVPNALHPTTEYPSEFDEDEFFDTMEHESAFSEMESVIVTDNFMAESDSVLDSDSHSLARSVRSRSRRKRQSSISDVSSISDGSATKLRGGANDPYLNAENLARLEETADEDAADDVDEIGEIDDESFQSAVSASQVLALIQNLEKDIGESKCSLSHVHEKLSELRAPESAALHGDQAQRLRLKNALQLEAERIQAELMAMTATRDDLKARVGALSSSAVSVARCTNRSVERASILLQTRKKRGSVGGEHSLAGAWSRSILQLSGTIESVTARLIFGPDVDRNKRSCFWIRFVNTSLVFIVSTKDNKIFLGNEGLSSGVNERGSEKSHHVFVGGSVDDYSTDILSSRFPHLIPPPSVDEKLLRVAITIVKAKPGADQSRLFRVRAAIGDFQLTPLPSYTQAVRSFMSQLNGQRESVISDKSKEHDKIMKIQPKSFFYDSLVTLSSVKILDGERKIVAAVVSDVTLRISGAATPQVYKERFQSDLRWGGLQLLYLGETAASMPIEFFCKGDAYAPLASVRIRAQKVLPEDEAGWVIGKPRTPNGNALVIPNVEFTRNVYVSLQFEALTFSFSPEILSAVLACKKSWVIHSALKARPKRPTGIPRIRLDAMVSKISIVCACCVQDLQGEDSGGQKILLRAGANATLQIGPEKKLTARAKLNGISLTFPDEVTPFLNPFTITVMADHQSDGHTKYHQDAPIMEAPDTCTWTCDQLHPEYPQFPGKTDMSCELLLTCLASQCELNVNPKNAAFGTALISRLGRCFKNETKTEVNISLEKRVMTINVRTNFDRIQISCFEQKNATLSRSSAPQFQLGTDQVMMVFQKRKLGSSLWARAKEIETIDFPHRRGIQSLGRSTLHKTTTTAVDEEHPMFEAEAAFNRVDEKIEADLSVSFGRFQILVLPSLLRAILTFKREFLSALEIALGNETRKCSDGIKRPDPILEGPVRVQITLGFDALEILLPTKDVSRSIREGACDIGVVSVRCGLEFRNSFSANDFGRLMEIENMENVSVHDVKTALEDFVARRMEQSRTGNVVNMSTVLLVKDFQILRTAMRVPSSNPIVFDTARSSSREQRVTNSFSVAFRYELASTIFERSLHRGGPSTKKITISQATEVKAEFVDILLYIARSDRGINTAIEATARPILTLLKGGKSTQVSDNSQPDRLSSLMRILATATSVSSFRIEGAQVTCVPGGATRLTESPIIKFTFFRIAAGCGIVGQAAPPGVRLTSRTNLNGLDAVSPKEYRHVIAGAWLSCEISAYYHNRRLVEWEPFIEPWSFVVRLGADLMRTLRLQAVPIEFDIFPETDTKSAERISPSPANRLAHLSRLLRSPFGTSQNFTGVLTKAEHSISDTDVCRVLLRLHALEILHSAIFRAPGAPNVDCLPPLPGENCLEWIQGHGYPVRSEASNSQPVVAPALMCYVSDEGSLDINFTGAMIDTLWQYLSNSNAKEIAPHLIQNRSGLTLRFEEVLDTDRSSAGEKAPKVSLETGKTAPLSLRRSLSQSCDPHKAYINLELGTFDETIGRIDPFVHGSAKGTRSSVFSYRIASKIPVDTVGTSRYPLELVGDRSSKLIERGPPGNLGYIIVKVRLEGGAKVVSVESPLSLSNTSELGIFFEMRENDGVSVLWSGYLDTMLPDQSVPIPADLAVSAYTKACKLFLVSVPNEVRNEAKQYVHTIDDDHIDQLKIPPVFTQASLSRGILSETDVSVRILGSDTRRSHFNVCSLRIGTISIDQQGKVSRDTKESSEIPEQRMLLFRSSMLFRNHLALPVEVQVRAHPTRTMSLVSSDAQGRANESSDWRNLGLLNSGAFLSWSGAAPWETLELRFRFVEEQGGTHRQFPSWSTSSVVPPYVPSSLNATKPRKSSAISRVALQEITVLDSEERRLVLSLCLSQGTDCAEKTSSSQTMEYFVDEINRSGRVVALFAPFWVIDQSGLNLQFRSGGEIAGQEKSVSGNLVDNEPNETLGLGELLDDRNMCHLPSRTPFRVYMIGDRRSSFINIRMGKNRLKAAYEAPWSTPVYLSRTRQSKDTVVVAPGTTPLELLSPEETGRDAFVVRSRMIDAPEQYGGVYGTKLLHIVCKYVVVNDLGHDIEISSGPRREDNAIIVKADSRPRPLSFISGQMRFRPKEFGWHWSGRFKVTLSRKDVTLRLYHGRKGHSMIANVEFHPGETAGTCVIIFRKASHAPYRIENHSMFPLIYYQRSPFTQSTLSKSSSSREQQDGVVLPYHSAAFAWDEPEDNWRSVGIQFADFGLLPSEMSREYLGRFDLDHISPGTEVQLPAEGLVARIIAEGPTRILRITGASSGESFGQVSPAKRRSENKWGLLQSLSVQIRLRNGVGISVVDWSPQELLYMDLQDIVGELDVDKGKETVSISVGYFAINNQLWVTPYPVALSIGSRSTRKRHRRVKALSCHWTRSVSSDDSFDGVTLLGKFEFASEPIDIRIDGRLASLVVDMAKQLKAVVNSRSSGKIDSKNGSKFNSYFLTSDDGPLDLAGDLYSSLDFIATNTIAAKLRHNYRPIHLTGSPRAEKSARFGLPFLKSKHKFYIERIRVSITSLSLSWHGFLPVSSVIRPAFFFEGLPIFMRPYVSSHIYGSVRDIVKGATSHFISVRRLVDVVVGAMVRKPFFIPREILTYFLSSTADTLQVAERSLISIAYASAESQTKLRYFERLSLPLTAFIAAILRGGVNALNAGSSIVRYGSISPRPTGAQLRSRNPRFFAHTDGNDLLVEYVEGENAGKALLSRVRMGAHLTEGYSFHVDEVFEVRTSGGNPQMDSNTLILMATHDRLMLLRGQLDDNFCNVSWEATFNDIAHVECNRVSDVPGHDIFTIWYLREHHGHDDSDDAVTRTVAAGSSGLRMLHPMNIFVPRAMARRLLEILEQER